MKKIIPSSGSFPLSHAIVHDHRYTMELSWYIGIDPQSGELEEGIEKQTARILEIIKNTLEKVGWKMSDITKAQIFLTDMKDYGKMNEVYTWYLDWVYPTRFALAVKELPRWALIEIECTATNETIHP